MMFEKQTYLLVEGKVLTIFLSSDLNISLVGISGPLPVCLSCCVLIESNCNDVPQEKPRAYSLGSSEHH